MRGRVVELEHRADNINLNERQRTEADHGGVELNNLLIDRLRCLILNIRNEHGVLPRLLHLAHADLNRECLSILANGFRNASCVDNVLDTSLVVCAEEVLVTNRKFLWHEGFHIRRERFLLRPAKRLRRRLAKRNNLPRVVDGDDGNGAQGHHDIIDCELLLEADFFRQVSEEADKGCLVVLVSHLLHADLNREKGTVTTTRDNAAGGADDRSFASLLIACKDAVVAHCDIVRHENLHVLANQIIATEPKLKQQRAVNDLDRADAVDGAEGDRAHLSNQLVNGLVLLHPLFLCAVNQVTNKRRRQARLLDLADEATNGETVPILVNGLKVTLGVDDCLLARLSVCFKIPIVVASNLFGHQQLDVLVHRLCVVVPKNLRRRLAELNNPTCVVDADDGDGAEVRDDVVDDVRFLKNNVLGKVFNKAEICGARTKVVCADFFDEDVH
eukprot:PhM_4_TR14236/c1_g1_i1/m.12457